MPRTYKVTVGGPAGAPVNGAAGAVETAVRSAVAAVATVTARVGNSSATLTAPRTAAASITIAGGAWNYNTGVMSRLDAGHTGSDARVSYPVVWYEDLYHAGDTVTQALYRLGPQSVVSFPEGVFQQADFAAGGGTWYSQIWPGAVMGVWGCGRGTVGGNVGTIFTMPVRSSTRSASVPLQGSSQPTQYRIVFSAGHQSYPAGPLSFAQFQVAGNDQGHIYHGMTVFQPSGPVTMHDCLFFGSLGDNGAPPGETFNLEIHVGKDDNVYDVECDGRRTIGGLPYSAVGMTVNTGSGAHITNCYFHHHRAANFVFFQYMDGKTYGMKIDKPFNNQDLGPDPAATYINQGVSHPTAAAVTAFDVNHEVTDGCEHWNPVLLQKPWSIGTPSSNTRGVNITHSNGSGYNTTVNGVARNEVNGDLKVVNPTFTPLWAEAITGSDPYLYLQSWVNGITDAPDTQTTPPLMVQSDGVTHFPYKWNKNNSTNVIP